MVFRVLLVAGVGFEPHDLRVMSPTSCQTAPSRDKYGAGSRGRTGTRNKSHGILSPGRLPIPPFRHATTYWSSTLLVYYIIYFYNCQYFLQDFEKIGISVLTFEIKYVIIYRQIDFPYVRLYADLPYIFAKQGENTLCNSTVRILKNEFFRAENTT